MKAVIFHICICLPFYHLDLESSENRVQSLLRNLNDTYLTVSYLKSSRTILQHPYGLYKCWCRVNLYALHYSRGGIATLQGHLLPNVSTCRRRLECFPSERRSTWFQPTFTYNQYRERENYIFMSISTNVNKLWSWLRDYRTFKSKNRIFLTPCKTFI